MSTTTDQHRPFTGLTWLRKHKAPAITAAVVVVALIVGSVVVITDAVEKANAKTALATANTHLAAAVRDQSAAQKKWVTAFTTASALDGNVRKITATDGGFFSAAQITELNNLVSTKEKTAWSSKAITLAATSTQTPKPATFSADAWLQKASSTNKAGLATMAPTMFTTPGVTHVTSKSETTAGYRAAASTATRAARADKALTATTTTATKELPVAWTAAANYALSDAARTVPSVAKTLLAKNTKATGSTKTVLNRTVTAVDQATTETRPTVLLTYLAAAKALTTSQAKAVAAAKAKAAAAAAAAAAGASSGAQGAAGTSGSTWTGSTYSGGSTYTGGSSYSAGASTGRATGGTASSSGTRSSGGAAPAAPSSGGGASAPTAPVVHAGLVTFSGGNYNGSCKAGTPLYSGEFHNDPTPRENTSYPFPWTGSSTVSGSTTSYTMYACSGD